MRAVLQQALDALESLFNFQVDEQRGERCVAAITAIKQALAQPERKPHEYKCEDCGLVGELQNICWCQAAKFKEQP